MESITYVPSEGLRASNPSFRTINFIGYFLDLACLGRRTSVPTVTGNVTKLLETPSKKVLTGLVKRSLELQGFKQEFTKAQASKSAEPSRSSTPGQPKWQESHVAGARLAEAPLAKSFQTWHWQFRSFPMACPSGIGPSSSAPLPAFLFIPALS